jgi:hypothetical protein
MDGLDKRDLKMDSRCHNGVSHRLSELGDNRLFCLIHNEGGKKKDEESQNDD